MFEKYSGTFFAVISMVIVPQIASYGFSLSCAEEIGTTIGTGLLVLAARYFKGGVNFVGVIKE